MAKLEELSTSAKRRSSGMRLTLTSTDTSPEKEGGGGGRGKSAGTAVAAAAAAAADSEAHHPSQTPEGDSQIIQWKDPKEEVERKILQEKLALETQVLAASREGVGGEAADGEGQVIRTC